MPLSATLTTATGEPLRPLQVPTSWAEVTLQQYLRLVTEPDAMPLAVLTGLSPDEVHSLALADGLLLSQALGFTRDAASLQELPPSEDLPEPGAASFGQMLLAMQHLEQQPEGQHELLSAPYLYALYRSHQLLGKHDDKRVEQMRQAVLSSPVTEVLADVLFIYGGWLISTHATPPNPTTTTKTTTGRKPAATIWGRVSGLFSRSTRSASPSA